MGVYVRGMKMPKECRECYLLEYYEYLGETQCSVTRRMLAERGKPISFDGRPGWCPLVEVPEPHGRLIDAGYLREHLYICETNGRPLHIMELDERLACIDEVPTVIEAEGER